MAFRVWQEKVNSGALKEHSCGLCGKPAQTSVEWSGMSVPAKKYGTTYRCIECFKTESEKTLLTTIEHVRAKLVQETEGSKKYVDLQQTIATAEKTLLKIRKLKDTAKPDGIEGE